MLHPIVAALEAMTVPRPWDVPELWQRHQLLFQVGQPVRPARRLVLGNLAVESFVVVVDVLPVLAQLLVGIGLPDVLKSLLVLGEEHKSSPTTLEAAGLDFDRCQEELPLRRPRRTPCSRSSRLTALKLIV
jgi:hypothetical protein